MPFLAPLVGVLGAIGGGSAVAGGLIAGSTALSAGLAIKGAVSKPSVPDVPTAAQSAASNTTAADKAAQDLKARARAAGGRQSTILTSPLGTPGAGPAANKTLLGQ